MAGSSDSSSCKTLPWRASPSSSSRARPPCRASPPPWGWTPTSPSRCRPATWCRPSTPSARAKPSAQDDLSPGLVGAELLAQFVHLPLAEEGQALGEVIVPRLPQTCHEEVLQVVRGA